MSRLDEIQARLDAATPGPWVVDRGWRTDGVGPESAHIAREVRPANPEPGVPYRVERVSVGIDTRSLEGLRGEQVMSNANLVAHAPADLSALVEFARRVEAVLDDHESTNEQVFDDLDRAMKRLIGGAS